MHHEIVRAQNQYQLIQSVSEGGRMRQKVLVPLGRHPTVENALKHQRKQLRQYRKALTTLEPMKHLDAKRFETARRRVLQTQEMVDRLTLASRLLATEAS